MIKFYILIYSILTSFLAFSQPDELKRDQQKYLFAYRQLILDDKFQKVLREYGFKDKVYIKRDANIFDEERKLEDFIQGKTIYIYSRKYMFMSQICFYLRINFMEWDGQIEAHIKTCSEGICDINYYRQKIVFEEKGGVWVGKKYQIERFTLDGPSLSSCC